MRLISEAINHTKRRRAYCTERWKHTERKEWKEELDHLTYMLNSLRKLEEGTTHVRSKPLSETTPAGRAIRPD
jgi:predicted NAD/FAD-binding protein